MTLCAVPAFSPGTAGRGARPYAPAADLLLALVGGWDEDVPVDHVLDPGLDDLLLVGRVVDGLAVEPQVLGVA